MNKNRILLLALTFLLSTNSAVLAAIVTVDEFDGSNPIPVKVTGDLLHPEEINSMTDVLRGIRHDEGVNPNVIVRPAPLSDLPGDTSDDTLIIPFDLDVTGDIEATGAICNGTGKCVGQGQWTEQLNGSNIPQALSYDDLSVGIGFDPANTTVLPKGQLHINRVGGQPPLVLSTGDVSTWALNGSAYDIVIGDSGSDYWGLTGASNFSIGNNTASKLLNIDPAGNVGIGTDTPSDRLQVEGTVFLSPNFHDGTYGKAVKIGWEGDPDVHHSIQSTISQGGAVNNGLRFYTHGGGADDNQVLTLSLLGNGNVGIGTQDPKATLDVAGSIRFGEDIGGICDATRVGATRYDAVSKKLQLCNGTVWSGTAGNVVAKFINGDDILDAAYMDGNVGVGTMTPTAKFEVVGGAIKATDGLIMETRATDPASPEYGQIWLRNDWGGVGWDPAGSGTVAYTVVKTSNETVTGGVVGWDLEIENLGGGFNLATETFLAPQNGVYYFHADLLSQNNTSPGDFRLYKNGFDTGIASFGGTTSSVKQSTISGLLVLDASDTIEIRAEGTEDVYGHAANYHTKFSGFLVSKGPGADTLPLCVDNQYLTFNSSTSLWECSDGERALPNCTNGQFILYNDTISNWECSNTDLLADTIGTDILDSEIHTFSMDSLVSGVTKQVADKINWTSTTNWASYGSQTSPATGDHWLKVDLGRKRFVNRFAVSGYPAANTHKPEGTWYLQGSNNNGDWDTLWEGPNNLWTNGGTSYAPQVIINVEKPDSYRYYRVFARSWRNNDMIVLNWAMYEGTEPAVAPTYTTVGTDIMDPFEHTFSSDSVVNAAWSHASYVADKTSWTTTSNAEKYGTHSNATQGTHWLKVDFGEGKYIDKFGVSGYPHGTSTYKPVGNWYLQGSNDDTAWNTIWEGENNLWGNGGVSYPPQNTLNIQKPDIYRYYRIIAPYWHNSAMIVQNWAMYEAAIPGTIPTYGTVGQDIMNSHEVTMSMDSGSGPAIYAIDKAGGNHYANSNTTQGTHWLKVDFGRTRYVDKFGISGFSTANQYKPQGDWYLQGSNDDTDWNTIWEGDKSLWQNIGSGSYPPTNTINITRPDHYRYYRIIAPYWYNSGMRVNNWAMYEGVEPGVIPTYDRIGEDLMNPYEVTMSIDSGSGPALYAIDKYGGNRYASSNTTQGTHWLQVDFGKKQYVDKFGVSGFSTANQYKPTGIWYIQGSNDEAGWDTIWEGDKALWQNIGTGSYPPTNTINITRPDSYRYYRIISQNWYNSGMRVNNWVMYKGVEPGTPPTYSMVGEDIMNPFEVAISASDVYNTSTAYAPVNAINKYNGNSYYHSTGAQGMHWLKVDFGQDKYVDKFAVSGYSTGSYKPVGLWYLQASDDDLAWETIWEGDADKWIASETTTYPPQTTLDITYPGSHRYYRIMATSWTNDTMLVNNWAMYEGTPAAPVAPASTIGTDIMDPFEHTFSMDSAVNASWDDGYKVADKINRTTTSAGEDYGVHSNTTRGTHWMKVDFGEGKYIDKFGVSGRSDNRYKPRGTWYLQGSNNDSDWDNVWEGENTLWTSGGTFYPPQNTISIDKPNTYRYYRIIAPGWETNTMQVMNWAMYEATPPGTSPAYTRIGEDIMDPFEHTITADSVLNSSWSYVENVADKTNRTGTASAEYYVARTNATQGIHWLKVDFGTQKFIDQFAVSGYPTVDTYKPRGDWYLEGSNDDSVWTKIWEGSESYWHNGGASYPPQQNITVQQPGSYRYYRIRANDWYNSAMMVMNWAMYEGDSVSPILVGHTTPGAFNGSEGKSPCKDILDGGASTGNGNYWYDPDGAGYKQAYQIYCDMTTDGGGWTFTNRLNNDGANGNPKSFFNDPVGTYLTSRTDNGLKYSTGKMDEWDDTEMMVTLDTADPVTADGWNKIVFYRYASDNVAFNTGPISCNNQNFEYKSSIAGGYSSGGHFSNCSGTYWYPVTSTNQNLGFMYNTSYGVYWGSGMGGTNGWRHDGWFYVR